MIPVMQPARGIWRWMIVLGLGLIVVFPITTAIQPLSTVLLFVLAAIFLVGGGVGAGLGTRGRIKQLASPPILVGGAMTLLASVTIIWSLNRSETVTGLIEAFGLIVFAMIYYVAFDRISFEVSLRRWVAWAITGTVVTAFVMVIADHYTHFLAHLKGEAFTGHHMNNSVMTVLTVFMWVCVGMMGKHRIVAFAFVTLSIVAVFHTNSMSAQLVAIAGATVYTISLIVRRSLAVPVLVLCVVLYGVMIFAGPLTARLLADMASAVPGANIGHRTEIWSAALQSIYERPWTGLGFHTSHIVTQEPYVTHLGDWATRAWTNPHNLSLALLYELGIGGFILGLVGLLSFFKLLRGVDGEDATLWAIMIATAFSHMAVGRYPWISWWQFGLLAAVLFGMLVLKRKTLQF